MWSLHAGKRHVHSDHPDSHPSGGLTPRSCCAFRGGVWVSSAPPPELCRVRGESDPLRVGSSTRIDDRFDDLQFRAKSLQRPVASLTARSTAEVPGPARARRPRAHVLATRIHARCFIRQSQSGSECVGHLCRRGIGAIREHRQQGFSHGALRILGSGRWSGAMSGPMSPPALQQRYRARRKDPRHPSQQTPGA